MNAPDTVTEALLLLAEQGYVENMQLIDGVISWADRCQHCAADAIEVDRVFRFEGDSDPGDEMVVFALHDPATGDKGALASGYGSSADPELLEVLQGLHSRFERRWAAQQNDTPS